jgi:hypothetical protein
MSSGLSAFLDSWTVDPNGIKPVFTAMYEYLRTRDRVSLEYKGRPGVSHSLRARHAAQNKRELFVLVDIIDDEPGARWLSVCFYADLVTDPEEHGDVVPGGLMGDDACCFDLDSPENNIERYMLQRLQEAVVTAAEM